MCQLLQRAPESLLGHGKRAAAGCRVEPLAFLHIVFWICLKLVCVVEGVCVCTQVAVPWEPVYFALPNSVQLPFGGNLSPFGSFRLCVLPRKRLQGCEKWPRCPRYCLCRCLGVSLLSSRSPLPVPVMVGLWEQHQEPLLACPLWSCGHIPWPSRCFRPGP